MRQVPSWDEYFMTIAKAVALRSKDPVTQVGCVLVDFNNHIVATGYNGMRAGTHETETLWSKPTKYTHVHHAEKNALEHTPQDIFKCEGPISCYVTTFPCCHCMNRILPVPIDRIVYLNEYTDFEISKNLFLNKSNTSILKLDNISQLS